MEVYFDNSATTRCYDSVKDIVVKTMTEDFGNPSAMHLKGVEAEKYVKEATKTIAGILKVQEKEILFTSGGTESDNLALIGGALANKRNGNHIIITSVEHAAVSQPALYLQEQGFEITYLPVDAQGRVKMSALEAVLRPDTIMVSTMLVNNEVGAVMPVEEIAKMVHEKSQKALYHVDAIQGFGKYHIYPKRMGINCFEVYGIHIWDVKNLLWLFEEFSDIKNEFISLLTYSIDDLQLEIPEPQLFEEKQIEKRERTWEERLKNIQPGKEFFKEYEKICTEILKNILGEYLGLWAVQEHSNEELYCFDLCCKIKNGVDQDFFNTIQNYFNTKYIVFEFKNYKEKITQREIYTTEKYLYKKALRSVAIIVSREGASRNALLAAKGCLRENGKLILCLSDKDLNELIHIKEKGEQPTAEFFEAMLDDILIHLEK